MWADFGTVLGTWNPDYEQVLVAGKRRDRVPQQARAMLILSGCGLPHFFPKADGFAMLFDRAVRSAWPVLQVVRGRFPRKAATPRRTGFVRIRRLIN